MNTKFVLIILFLSIISIAFAQNHMDIMATMQGSHGNSLFGDTMATLDFNHDGFDDLVVCSRGWNSNFLVGRSIRGKVDIFFGGPNFDNIPDITMEGQYDNQYKSVVNIGDINGDGFDDLFINGKESTSPPVVFYLRIYAGGDSSPTEPDILIPYTLPTDGSLYEVVKLGDINSDGYDDIGFSIESFTIPDALTFNIVWGNSLITESITTSCAWSEFYSIGFTGIGDINGDSYDDFAIGYTNPNPNTGYHLITIYYGNSGNSLTDTMILTQIQAAITKLSIPLGDFNGDGIDDFMGYQSNAGLNVWFGATETDTIPNIFLNPPLQDGEYGISLKYGDLNNDGFDDVVGADYFANQFSIWFGRTQPNGDSDLLIGSPSNPNNTLAYFGKGLTMGDYNGDDCCDIAISAPFTDDSMANDYRGYVYIYAGNDALADTATTVDDPISSSIVSPLNIRISPNPTWVSNRYISIKVENTITNDKSPIEISIYNIRGQCVQNTHSDKATISNTFVMDISNMASGIYLCRVKKGKSVDTKKISIVK